MCEQEQLENHFDNNKYNFSDIFSSVQSYFQHSNYVVGNLETPIAGKTLEYCNHKYSFNTPESFLESIKNCGIDLVTTANNHCLDRGVAGLKQTIKNLDNYQIKHIGTYSNKKKNHLLKRLMELKLDFYLIHMEQMHLLIKII